MKYVNIGEMINWKSFKNRSNDNLGWSVPSDPFERLMFHLESSLIPINHPFCIKIPSNTVYRSELDVRSIGYCTIRAYDRINWWITWPESEKVLSPYWGLSKWFLINPLSSLSSIAVFWVDQSIITLIKWVWNGPYQVSVGGTRGNSGVIRG